MEKTECWWKWYTFAIFPIFGCPTAMKHRDRWHFKFRINSMNCNLQNFRNGCGVCNYRKKLFVFVGCRFIILFLLVIGWGNINNMLVKCIVVHLLNLFCMCFGYVPWSNNFGVNCFILETTLFSINFLLGCSIMGCPPWRCYEVWKCVCFSCLSLFLWTHLSLTSFPPSVQRFRIIKNLDIWRTIT